MIGEGFTPNGQFPFIDELNLKSLSKKRIYQSTYTDKMEEIFDIMDVAKGEVLIRLQSKNEFPNYYIRHLKKRMAPMQLTHFPNPFESIKNVYKELIKYKILSFALSFSLLYSNRATLNSSLSNSSPDL